jgi:hypothetical protein
MSPHLWVVSLRLNFWLRLLHVVLENALLLLNSIVNVFERISIALLRIYILKYFYNFKLLVLWDYLL